MRKLLIPVIFLLSCIPALSQGWVYISGTVSDSLNGLPIANYPVTVMTDSTYGVFYYNVVYTDSTGHYFDEVPYSQDTTGILYVQTYDCRQILHQAVIELNPNSNTYTQDFHICYSGSTGCQAYYEFTPQPEGSPDSFQFNDYSQGDIIAWAWSFGDGTGSVEQNPFHTYPGPGIYEACLTITGNNCTDTYCSAIVITIIDTVYQQLYGQVYAGNFPLQQGSVQLFTMNPIGSYTPFGEPCEIDSNGVYYFTLVPEGIYLVQAVPYDSVGFLPTYFGNVITWQQATQVVLGIPDNPYNISLVAAGPMTFGPGSVTGQINTINLQRSSVDKMNIMLMNETGTAIGFSGVNSSGYFDFRTMDYGVYFLRAELSGVTCDNIRIEITAENPHLEVVLSFSGNSVLGIDDPKARGEILTVYPNPVTDRLNIALELRAQTTVYLDLFTLTGQSVYTACEPARDGHNVFSIDASGFPAGIYTLRAISGDGINFSRKVIIGK